MKNKVENWLEKRGQIIKEEWIQIVEERIKECQSPIEKLFLIEALYQTEWNNGFSSYPNEDTFIFPQFQINNYRVDFMIFTATYQEWRIPDLYNFPSTNKNRCLVVEVDSYLWHGSEPEQFAKEKAREREIIKEGFAVMRFSGREIYRNMEKCIEEVREHFANLNQKRMKKDGVI